ncbi:MAG: biopolymer transport protein TolR [Paraglaciecola sp.]
MKQSARARRMERNHKRNAKQTKLSLVSLMDIFTILVFFLMLNASEVQVLQSDKSVTLPTSSADNAATENLLLLVTQNHVLLQGKKMADVADVLASNEDVVATLVAQLTYQSERVSTLAAQVVVHENTGKAITIMADQAIPYALLKKLMQSCAQAGYTDIALAVEHKDVSLAATGGA